MRPHEALGQTCPAQHDIASNRPWPRRLPPLGHPADARWAVSFGPLQLGVWAPRDDTFTPALRWLDNTAVPSPASAPVSPIIPV